MNRMSKSEVYSWRITPALKAQLETVARKEKTTLAALLERIASDWLRERVSADDEVEQKRMRDAILACAGTYKSDGSSATNARVRQVMGEYLEARRARQRPR
jgi:putative NIF3 family GTP cyclohydrolase 1 type 2